MSGAIPPLVVTAEQVGDAELHTLPSGVQVVYRDRDHSYWAGATALADGSAKCSGRLTGISTVVCPFDWRPDNLMAWAARTNAAGIAALAAEGLSQEDVENMRACLTFLTSGESIEDALTQARLRYADARDDAATRGTNVHKHALHALATGDPVPRRKDLTVEEWGYARGIMAFWHECEPDPFFAEQVVADPELGVAGRFDLICDLTLNGCRQRVVADAKTSGFIPTKHHVQLAGYTHCAEVSGLVPEEGHGSLDCALILQVTPEGGYDLVPSEAEREDFTAAIDVYRRAARIQRETNATRKAGV